MFFSFRLRFCYGFWQFLVNIFKSIYWRPHFQRHHKFQLIDISQKFSPSFLNLSQNTVYFDEKKNEINEVFIHLETKSYRQFIVYTTKKNFEQRFEVLFSSYFKLSTIPLNPQSFIVWRGGETVKIAPFA